MEFTYISPLHYEWPCTKQGEMGPSAVWRSSCKTKQSLKKDTTTQWKIEVAVQNSVLYPLILITLVFRLSQLKDLFSTGTAFNVFLLLHSLARYHELEYNTIIQTVWNIASAHSNSLW